MSEGLIARLRGFIEREATDLKVRASVRFDGVERTEADPQAVEDLESCEAMLRLIEIAAADPVVLARLASAVKRAMEPL